MDVRWQDEVRWLSDWVYKPEKEKWQRENNAILGNYHWSAYVSKYAEIRKIEIHKGNSLDIVTSRIKHFHPIVWLWAMDMYKQQ